MGSWPFRMDRYASMASSRVVIFHSVYGPWIREDVPDCAMGAKREVPVPPPAIPVVRIVAGVGLRASAHHACSGLPGSDVYAP